MRSQVVRVRVLVATALAVLIGAAALAATTNDVGFVGGDIAERVVAQLSSQNVAAAVVLSSMLMIVAALTPFPAEAVAIANGAYFGATIGLLVTWTSALAGASIAFGLSRSLGARLWSGRHQQSVEDAADWLGRNGGRLLLIARLVPLIPFFVVNFGAGLTPMSWRTYLLLSAVGILPFSTLLVVSGAGMSALVGI